MSEELLKGPDGFSAEPRIISDEVAKLRAEVARLCQAVQSLVKLQSIANQKLDKALTGSPSFEVL